MAVLLALCSAATYGVGDFLGGLAAKRAAAAAVLLWSHLAGVVLLLGTTLVIAGEATTHDLAVGAIGGLAGAAGVGLLYQALSIGPMSAVAPVTALLAAAVPVVAGIADGERPGVAAAVGMVAALAAVVLISAEGGGSFRPSDLRGVTLALGAGLGFGLFFVALSYTDDGSGVWPLVGARTASVIVVGALAVLGRFRAHVPAGDARALTAGAGALDVAANVLYLLAIREGLLSVVSVLASLYPASTVVLAWIVLRERFAPMQRVGLVLAVPAVVLMAI
jgi:drug/metabolite transporter (DMT)-like permease